MHRILIYFLVLLACSLEATASIPRKQIVQAFNVHRNASSATTPLQLGNGNFAFGVDVTGLQTFQPFGTLSSWGWHNFSLPTTPGQTSIEDFTGLDWMAHGRLVNYAQPNPAQNDISNWLRENPHRLNLARIGLTFGGDKVSEEQLTDKSQVLDLWSGKISSSFKHHGVPVEVETWVHPDVDVIGISIKSSLLSNGSLGIFFDYPYPDNQKFNAPFVGVWNETKRHSVTTSGNSPFYLEMKHTLDDIEYYVVAQADFPARRSNPGPGSNRYSYTFSNTNEIVMTVAFSLTGDTFGATYSDTADQSSTFWADYWNKGAFIDLVSGNVDNSTARTELQRRIILSQYLTAVNGAGVDPPQESGLVNNGWYGKFHLEMCFWHIIPFARWNHFSLFERSMPGMYQRFLQSSYDRAKAQGYKGARWGKMTDPDGRSAPGEINSLLIWQQPHPMYFAETQYRSFPTNVTLKAWDQILTATADFMVSYAYFNATTRVFDLGPPMYPVSENTQPNMTVNPTFELAYWRFGLDIAAKWKQRQNLTVPESWISVRDNLAPLPVEPDGTYPVYQGIPNMWTDPKTTFDHPAMAGVFGWLPPPMSGPPLNMTVVRNTAAKIKQTWALQESYGWDFALLAMNSMRLGDPDGAVEYLLHPVFQFDDAGYPVGGSRVPTPYFPNAASLLVAMAMMGGGWDGEAGPHFPKEWQVAVEGFVPGM